MDAAPGIQDDAEERANRLDLQVKQTKGKMELETRSFIEAAKTFTCEWVMREAKRAEFFPENVTSPEYAKPAPEKLNGLKPGLNEIITRIPAIVEDQLNLDELWIHRNKLPHPGISRDYLEYKKEKTRRELTARIRMILGCAGELLSEQENVALGDKEWVRERGRRKYACLLRFSEEMTSSLSRYFALLEELLFLEYELKEER
ncbi:hypothetical protein FTO70_03235 [Methanosarcina sp. KYL-1]|uniref:hypothetical protein n=1 Tax=Methanosarcina sp. KYL-1 TaxID=2602068 RepID=UPI0021014D4C|nr:hypothetical protein [Methanosarcina sp. KYL-1]MCQ1534719.1 hypothetical protein [Methanosarcina sp. KYL-1]